MVTAITKSPTAREMKRIIWIRLTSVKMRALSVLVLPVIVWTGPARTMPLTVNVLRKTALLILLQHVQVLSLAKQPVAETVNNVAPIPVPAVQNPIPVPMPRQLNAEPSVIIAIPAVLQEAHLIPVRWLDITNADRLVKTVLRLVHPDILRLIPADVMIQRLMNAVIPAINRKPVAPIPVPVVLRLIPVPMLRQPNAEPSVTIAIPAALQEARLIPVR